MSIYTFFLAAGSSCGPIVNGWVGQKLTLQWYWWLCAIAAGINLLAAFFLLPETNYQRNIHIDSTESLHPIPDTVYPTQNMHTTGDGMTFTKIIAFHKPALPISSLPTISSVHSLSSLSPPYSGQSSLMEISLHGWLLPISRNRSFFHNHPTSSPSVQQVPPPSLHSSVSASVR